MMFSFKILTPELWYFHQSKYFYTHRVLVSACKLQYCKLYTSYPTRLLPCDFCTVQEQITFKQIPCIFMSFFGDRVAIAALVLLCTDCKSLWNSTEGIMTNLLLSSDYMHPVWKHMHLYSHGCYSSQCMYSGFSWDFHVILLGLAILLLDLSESKVMWGRVEKINMSFSTSGWC